MYVSDGLALMQGTDESGDDSFATPQQRSCARGRSMRKWLFGDNRLKYPLKRKSWQPGGEQVNGHLRGIDEWERISWDEALDIIADEYKRIRDTYGPQSVLNVANNTQVTAFLANGGYASGWGPLSFGSYIAAGNSMVGIADYTASITGSDRYEYLESKLIVLWASNPVATTQGAITNLLEAKSRGAKIVVVDPVYTETAQVLADEYIPVRPGTDSALMLAMAYVMIDENLQDQEFLDTYTIGFDAEHMPEGADTRENFKDYVLGTYDGVPKTPAWASKICGTPEEIIASFAREVAQTKPAALHVARVLGRYAYGEQALQTFLTMGWMTGNVGKPGAMVGFAAGNNRGIGGVGGGSKLVSAGSVQNPNSYDNPVSYPYFIQLPDANDLTEKYCINFSEIWDAVLDGEFTAGTAGKKPIDVRMLFAFSNNAVSQQPGATRAIDAYRSVECAVGFGFTMQPQCKYADIVLPECSNLELAGNRAYTKMDGEVLLAAQQICDPLFEAKSLDWVQVQLGERFGMTPEEIDPFTEEQKAFETLRGAAVLGEDGQTMEPLFTIEAADIPEDIDAEPQQGKIPLSQFLKDKVYRVALPEGDARRHCALADYVADPVANPRPTPSGKLEIYCETLKSVVDGFGYNAMPWSATPHYVASVEGYETTFEDWDAQTKGEYPYQLFAVHGMRTCHSGYDQVPWLREAFPNGLMINPEDAKACGVENGDTVLVESRWGKVLRHASVTSAIMPGVLRLDEGAWIDMDEETGIDRGGNANILLGAHKTGAGIQAYDSCNVRIEKYAGDELPADYQRLQPVVEA